MAASSAVDSGVVHVLKPSEMVAAHSRRSSDEARPVHLGPARYREEPDRPADRDRAGHRVHRHPPSRSLIRPICAACPTRPTRAGARVCAGAFPTSFRRTSTLDFVHTLREACDERIEIANPRGSNGIHYCTNPRIVVTSLTPGCGRQDRPAIRRQRPRRDPVLQRRGSVLDRRDLRCAAAAAEPRPDLRRSRRRGRQPRRGQGPGQGQGQGPGDHRPGGVQLGRPDRHGRELPVHPGPAARRVRDPGGVMVMAMGNRETDKGLVFKLPSPSSNRFEHLEMKCDPPDWLDWAYGANVQPARGRLHLGLQQPAVRLRPAKASRAFATPRSWEMLSTSSGRTRTSRR